MATVVLGTATTSAIMPIRAEKPLPRLNTDLCLPDAAEGEPVDPTWPGAAQRASSARGSLLRGRPPPADRVLTLPEAAAHVGVSPDTLRRCAQRGELKILQLSPRRVGIRLSDLKAYLDGRG
jgi:excisionase family DNA binding protein